MKSAKVIKHNIKECRHNKWAVVINLCIVLILGFGLSSTLSAQDGCTDPMADNFDSTAVTNDGSCTYPLTFQTPTFLYFLSEANPNMSENSGIDLADDGTVLNINDGGNPPVIIVTEQETGWLNKNIELQGASNVDWEEVANSPDYYFVGDFGNNTNGAREDLTIYRIDKDSITGEPWQQVVPEVITYYYPEQGTPEPVGLDETAWDCEAMFWENDEIHIFTKDWTTFTTRHYKMPDEPGDYAAELVEEFDCQGLITAADRYDDRIVMLGYTIVNTVFMYVLWDYQPGEYFSGNKRRIELGFAVDHAQTEGICLDGPLSGFISSERFIFGDFINVAPQMLSFTLDDYFTGIEELPTQQFMPEVWPTLGDGLIYHNLPADTQIQLWDASGKLIESAVVSSTLHDFGTLSPGGYVLTFMYSGQKYVQRLTIQ